MAEEYKKVFGNMPLEDAVAKVIGALRLISHAKILEARVFEQGIENASIDAASSVDNAYARISQELSSTGFTSPFLCFHAAVNALNDFSGKAEYDWLRPIYGIAPKKYASEHADELSQEHARLLRA